MRFKSSLMWSTGAVSVLSTALMLAGAPSSVLAQEQTAAVEAVDPLEEAAPEPLTSEELEVLVARIALYPDELVATITTASLFPLQIVQAARFLDEVKAKPETKPDENWDGSVVSLLNYPEILKMMNDDLDWTQMMGEAIANQQKDVLEAIQQLRDKAVAENVIKSDEKIRVVTENNNVIIQSASPEVVYVPQYEPEMLYEPDYVYRPITYYPDPRPHYYDPGATYFAGFVTGAIWAAVVDWDDWGVWGGSNWGNDIDIDIDCKRCFNDVDFDGKVNFNKVDWRKVDRTKISFDRKQLTKIDNRKIKSDVKTTLKKDTRNNVRNKASVVKNERTAKLPAKAGKPADIRKETVKNLKKPQRPATRPAVVDKPKVTAPSVSNKDRPQVDLKRPVGKPKPAARPDVRPKAPKPLGEVERGRDAKLKSDRGRKAMGGGLNKGGGGKPKIDQPSKGKKKIIRQKK